MAERLTAPKGTYDVLPADQPVRQWVIDRAESVFARYGYGRIDTPAFEDTKLFSRGVGDSTDIVRKEMYTFADLGGRSMTLRPEGTAPVARAYVQHGMHTWPQPVKLYYHSPMFRYESPQAGRYRQHYQLGIEAIGSSAPELDAEVIGVLAAVLGEVGLNDLDLRVNSMGCRACRPAYSTVLREFLAGEATPLCGDCHVRATLNPLRVFDCKKEACRSVVADAPRLADHMCNACDEHHARVRECLTIQSIGFRTDHTLVRGMDYYTRTTFEFDSPCLGAQSGVGGGGRYDDLIEAIGGPAVPGVGFGAGVERILLALSSAGTVPAVARDPVAFVVALDDSARGEAFAVAHELRAAGAAADLDYVGRSVKGQMTQASRSGAHFAFIIGEREMREGVITVRDLRAATESVLPRSDALALAIEAAEGMAAAS